MRLIYNSDAQRLQKNFDDKTPITVSELFRSERTASVPIELFLIDNDGGYATPGSSDYEVLIGRQAQAITTGKLTLTFTGTTEEIDLSKPKLATRIEAALNAVSEVNAAGGVDVVELKNGRAFQITFRSVGSRAAITAGVKDSMQPASVIISEVTAGTGSTREVQLLTLEEASLAEISTSGWSANSNPALAISTLVEGTANTREVVQLSVTGDPAPGSFFVVSNSEPISTEATAAQVKTILNSALSSDIGSVKKTGERIWQITYKTNGDKSALSAGTHNLVKRPSVTGTLSLNTTALAYASNSDGSDLSVGFTLKKSNEVLLSENVDLAEPFAEVIGSSAMLNNDSLGALFTIGGDDVNKGTAISLSGGLTYSSDTLAAPFLPLAGGTMTGNAVFNDGVKAIFGTASDGIELYHQSNHSYLADTGTGALKILGSQIEINNAANSENIATFTQDGGAALFFNNSKKIESTNLGCTISGKLIVNGDMDVSGTTTTFNSTVVTVDDPVFGIGGDTAPGSDDNKDRGIEFRYYSGSAKIGFFGYDDSENAFTFLTDATNNSEVFSGTLGSIKVGGGTVTGTLYVGDSIDHWGDGGTGLSFPSNDVVAFKTSGTEAARFTSDGKFSIGGVSNPSHQMQIHNSGTGSQMNFTDSNSGSTDGSGLRVGWNGTYGQIYLFENSYLRFGTNNTEAARFDSDGRLLIGATSGTKLLTVNGNVGCSALTAGTGIELHTSGTTNFLSSQESGNNFTIRNTGANKDIIFQVSDGSLTELLRLDGSASNVGIGGVTSPSAKLDIQLEAGAWSVGSAFSNQAVRISGGSGGLGLAYDDTTGATIAAIHHGNAYKVINFDGASYKFNINSSEKMRLDSTGLGIGVTPSAKLHVKENSDTAPTAQFYQEHTSGRGLLVQTESQLSNRYAFKVESTGGSTNIIYAAAGGNVGIGTSSPSCLLDIYNASGWGELHLDGSSGGELKLQKAGTTHLDLYASDSGSTGSVIKAQSNLLISSNNTTDANRSIYLNSSGNVGIGTTSPQETIHAYSTSHTRIQSQSTTGVAAFKATNNNGSYAWYVSNVNDTFRLYDFNDSADRLTVDGSGNVGISTTAPSCLLNLNDANNNLSHQLGFSYESGGSKVDAFTIGRNNSTGNLEFHSDINNHGFEFKHNGAGTQEFNILNMKCGIGTDAPSEQLTNYSASGNVTTLTQVGGSGNADLQLKNNSGDRTIRATADKLWFIDNTDTRTDMVIDGSGNVAIGQTSAYSPTGAGVTRLTATNSADSNTNLVVSNQNNGTAAMARLVLATYGHDYIIGAQSLAGGSALTFSKASAERFRINSDGDIEQNYINYTDGSNYEALKISAESDHILFKTESIGSFASNTRPILFKTGANTRAQIDNTGLVSYANLYISGTGSLRNTGNHLNIATSTQTDNDIVFKPNDTEKVRISTDYFRVRDSSGKVVQIQASVGNEARILANNVDHGTALNLVLSSEQLKIKTDQGAVHSATFDETGDLELLTDGKGLILSSPDGTRYKITVANGGAVTSTAM